MAGCQQLRQTIDVCPANITVVVHTDLAFLTLFGGDENHTVGSSRTVDGTTGSILQHVDTLNVGRVQVVDVTTAHTVNNVERLGVAIGTSTADGNLEAVARLTRIGLDANTGALALQGTKYLCGVQFSNVLTLHFYSSTGHEFLLLHTVTHDYHFFKLSVVFLHGHVDSRLIANCNLLCQKADVADHQRSTGLHIEREVTVDVGNCTVTCALFQNAGADNGSHGVNNRT